MSRFQQLPPWQLCLLSAVLIGSSSLAGAAPRALPQAQSLTVSIERSTAHLEGSLRRPVDSAGRQLDFWLAASLEPRAAAWRPEGAGSRPLGIEAGAVVGGARRWTLLFPAAAGAGAGEIVLTWEGALPPAGSAVGIGTAGVWLPADSGWYPRFEGGSPRPYRLHLLGVGSSQVLVSGAPEPGPNAEQGLRLASSLPVDGIDLLVVDRQVYRAPGQGTLVEVWAGKGTDPVEARRLAARLRDLTAELSSLLGAPPWPRVVVTTAGVEAPRALPGALLLPGGQWSRALAEVRIDWWRRLWIRQWFGAGLYPEPGEEGSIAGVARWTEGLFLPPARAQAERRRYLRLAGEPWRDPDAALAPAMQLHMLEILVGRQRVLGALREILARYRGRRVGHEALSTLLRLAAGPAHRVWVEAWEGLERPPRLSVGAVRQRQQGERHSLEVEVLSDLPCRLPIPIVARGATGREVSGLGRLVGRSVTILLRADFPIEEIEVDPRWDLLRAVDPEDRPPVFGRLRAGADLVVVGSARGRRLASRARLAAVAFFPGATVVSDREVSRSRWEQAGRVVVLGRASDRFWSTVGVDRGAREALLSEARRVGAGGHASSLAGAFAAVALAHGSSGAGVALLVDALEAAHLARALEAVGRHPDAGWVFSADGRGQLTGDRSWEASSLRLSLTEVSGGRGAAAGVGQ